MQRDAEGMMFLTRPSVSPSIRFLSAQLLWNRSAEFRETLVLLCTWCVDVHISKKFWFNFFVMPLLNLEICQKWNMLLIQFDSLTPLKLLNKIWWKFVDSEGYTVYMCIFAGNSDSSHWASYAPLKLRNFAKIKCNSEISCQCISSKPLNRILRYFVQCSC